MIPGLRTLRVSYPDLILASIVHNVADPHPKQAFAIRPSDRCTQYRATFISDNGDRYPVLDRVAVGLST